MESEIGDMPDMPVDGGVEIGDAPDLPVDGGVEIGDTPDLPVDGGTDIGDAPDMPVDGGVEIGDAPAADDEIAPIVDGEGTPPTDGGDTPEVDDSPSAAAAGGGNGGDNGGNGKKAQWDDSGKDPSADPLPRYGAGQEAWDREADAIEANTRRVNEEQGSLENDRQRLLHEMYAPSGSSPGATGDAPQETEQGDLVDGSAEGDHTSDVDGEASPATSGEDDGVPEQPDREITLPGSDDSATGPEIEPIPETTLITATEDAKLQSPDRDSGLTPKDEDFLAEIQRAREEQQQDIHDDAEALSHKFGPQPAVDGIATEDADVKALEQRVETLKAETYTRETAELASLQADDEASSTTTTETVPESQAPKQPNTADDPKTIHPRPESVEIRPELEPNPEYSPVTIKDPEGKTPLEGSEPRITEGRRKEVRIGEQSNLDADISEETSSSQPETTESQARKQLEPSEWVTSMRDVTVKDLPDPPDIHSAEDFHKISEEQMRRGIERLQEMKPQIDIGEGASSDYWYNLDQQHGLGPGDGYQSTYDAFYGNDRIHIDKNGDQYDIVNGRHRIWVAKQMGVDTLPAEVAERRKQ